MAKKSLKSRYGWVSLFKNNPRVIREGQFNALIQSMEAHPEFMVAQKIVLWQVPEALEVAEGEKCPFKGQEGELIVLSGNQRAKSILAQGGETIPDEWCCEAKGSDGEWWGWRDAEIFLNLANSPAGLSGDYDYGKLQEMFDEFRMRMAGIDFSNFTEAISQGTLGESGDGGEGEEVDDIEADPLHGEKSPELEAFIAERERTRQSLKEIDEAGFHLLLVFPEGYLEKCEFLSKCGAFGGVISVDYGPYVDLVFETYDQKMKFAEDAGLLRDDPVDGVPPMMGGMFCDGRAFARKMGIELAETGLHFRDRIVDTQLAEMAVEPERQKTEAEIQEEIYARLKAERKGLGMSARSSGERGDKGEGEE